MDGGKVILYTTADGHTSIQLRVENGSVWLTQLELAELFQTSKQNISLHIKNILEEKELDEAVVKEDLTTASDGKRYQTIGDPKKKPRKNPLIWNSRIGS